MSMSVPRGAPSAAPPRRVPSPARSRVRTKNHEIKSLQQHVTEFCVTDAGLAVFYARADGFFRNHLVDGKMLSDVAQEIQIRNFLRPRGVVQKFCGIIFWSFRGVKFKQLCQL